ncbi:hypothetical protein DPMN_050780, partial [Dreissena polymorpha]
AIDQVRAVSQEEERAKNTFALSDKFSTSVAPISANCCKSLGGCKTCVDTWYESTLPVRWPTCKSQDGTRRAVTGLHEAVHLKAIWTSLQHECPFDSMFREGRFRMLDEYGCK